MSVPHNKLCIIYCLDIYYIIIKQYRKHQKHLIIATRVTVTYITLSVHFVHCTLVTMMSLQHGYGYVFLCAILLCIIQCWLLLGIWRCTVYSFNYITLYYTILYCFIVWFYYIVYAASTFFFWTVHFAAVIMQILSYCSVILVFLVMDTC